MLKILGFIGAGLIILALTIGIGVKMTQKAEGYKAQDDQFFYSFDYHPFIGGCARYDAFRKREESAQQKQVSSGSQQGQSTIKKAQK